MYRFGTVDRISPEAPVPVFKFSHDTSKPGMAANVRDNLESLGCMVVPMLGKQSTKMRFIDVRSKQHIMRSDWDIEDVPLKFEDIPYNLNNVDAIVISDYNKGYVSYELIEELIANFKGSVFVDTKKTDLARLEGAYIKINELEYSRLVSKCSGIIVTRGAHGAYYNDVIIPACNVEVSDVCGAGDTFLSALAYRYCLSKDIIDAIEFAVKASAITVQHLGNYAPTLEEIK